MRQFQRGVDRHGFLGHMSFALLKRIEAQGFLRILIYIKR